MEVKEKDKKEEICRPAKLTCRWLREISESIHTLCPSKQIIEKCQVGKEEKMWNEWLSDLSGECKSSKNFNQIQRILSYEIDYNQFRNEK